MRKYILVLFLILLCVYITIYINEYFSPKKLDFESENDAIEYSKYLDNKFNGIDINSEK